MLCIEWIRCIALSEYRCYFILTNDSQRDSGDYTSVLRPSFVISITASLTSTSPVAMPTSVVSSPTPPLLTPTLI